MNSLMRSSGMMPGDKLPLLGAGLDKAGRTLGVKYPVPFYQNFQPEFP